VLLRSALPEDAPAIAEVHVSSWRTTYRGLLPDSVLAALSVEQREPMWRQVTTEMLTGESRSCVFVAEDPVMGVVGFANAGPEREEGADVDGELYAIYLLEQHQRAGLGRELVMRAVDFLVEQGHRSMRVWVLEGNPAQGFYERLGGQRSGKQTITVAGASFDEIAYVWPDVTEFKRNDSDC